MTFPRGGGFGRNLVDATAEAADGALEWRKLAAIPV